MSEEHLLSEYQQFRTSCELLPTRYVIKCVPTSGEADALIIDEPAGREAAKRQGLRVIGTLRVLYDAAEAGLCNLEQAYERLQQTTFRAHPDLYRAFLDMYSQRRE